MNWFRGGRAEPPAPYGFVPAYNAPTPAQQQREREAQASRRWALTLASRRLEEARAWELAQIERQSARERQIREHAKAKAEAIRQARAENGPRWDEDPIDYRCRIEAEDEIRRQRAGSTPDAVDRTLQRSGSPTRSRRSWAGLSQEEIRAEMAADLRAILPPSPRVKSRAESIPPVLFTPAVQQRMREQRQQTAALRLGPAMALRDEVRG